MRAFRSPLAFRAFALAIVWLPDNQRFEGGSLPGNSAGTRVSD